MKKIKLFSHADLDGYGCKLLMNLLQNTCIDTSYLDGSYESLMNIRDYILNKEYKEYDMTFVTDLVVNEEIIKAINSVNDLNIKVLDHHRTSLWMNKYDWATIKVDGDSEPTCGTELVFELIKDDLRHIQSENKDLYQNILDMIQTIKRYDTWLWFRKYNDIIPKKLNDLFYILGEKNFDNSVIKNNYDVKVILEEYTFLLKLEQEKIDDYVLRKNQELILKKIDKYIVGIVFAEQYQSELGNRLASLNPNCDIIVMISDLFIRCRTIKENVNCAEFAIRFGGAGQLQASGAIISKKAKDEIIKIVLS